MNGATDETKPGSTSSEQHRIHRPVMPKSVAQQSPQPGDPPPASASTTRWTMSMSTCREKLQRNNNVVERQGAAETTGWARSKQRDCEGRTLKRDHHARTHSS
jgi:hypothetical protein